MFFVFSDQLCCVLCLILNKGLCTVKTLIPATVLHKSIVFYVFGLIPHLQYEVPGEFGWETFNFEWKKGRKMTDSLLLEKQMGTSNGW